MSCSRSESRVRSQLAKVVMDRSQQAGGPRTTPLWGLWTKQGRLRRPCPQPIEQLLADARSEAERHKRLPKASGSGERELAAGEPKVVGDLHDDEVGRDEGVALRLECELGFSHRDVDTNRTPCTLK